MRVKLSLRTNRAKFGLALLLGINCTAVLSETVPVAQSNESRLVKDSPVAKVQAARTIQTFMNTGTRSCPPGQATGCTNLIGQDGNMNYGLIEKNAKKLLGTQSVDFDSKTESSNVSTQMAEIALKCEERKPIVRAGIAFKTISCSVDAALNAKLSFQVCTAPSRGKPVTNPDNAVTCSDVPTDATYLPPKGSVCIQKACDSEAVGSEFGWSAIQNAVYTLTSTSQDNGRAMVFYPALGGGITADYTADSDNLVVAKIVDTYRDATKTPIIESVGIKLALRFKRQITKDTLAGKGPVIANPANNTEQWRTVEALNANPLLATETAIMGGEGATCIKNVVDGLALDGTVKVCDETYNKNGVTPKVVSAQVVASAAQCTTTTQCISEIVRSSTWTESCSSPANIASKECHQTTAWKIEVQTGTVVRELAQCTETRTTMPGPSCTVSAGSPTCNWYAIYPPPPTQSCGPGPIVPPATSAPQVCKTIVPALATTYSVCTAGPITDGCALAESYR